MPQHPRYLVIGNGRVARHFCRYLALLSLPAAQWSRAEPVSRLNERLADATHVLLLIADRAIEPFAEQHLERLSATKVHFSGALVTPLAHGAHPLMTFNTGLYTLDRYRAIPFVLDATAPPFEALLPGLPNAHARIAPELKAKYHAMCVLSGNFSCLLWQRFFDVLAAEFKLPPEIGRPYLRQQMENLLADPASALTGPLTRGDTETIEKHLTALTGDPFKTVYRSFVDAYPAMKEKAQ